MILLGLIPHAMIRRRGFSHPTNANIVNLHRTTLQRKPIFSQIRGLERPKVIIHHMMMLTLILILILILMLMVLGRGRSRHHGHVGVLVAKVEEVFDLDAFRGET